MKIQLSPIKYLLTSLCIAALCSNTNAQFPKKNWSFHYGGSGIDIPFVIKSTVSGGTIAAGYTDSKDGQVGDHANREYWDLWIIKLNNCGIIEWERSLGGTGYETARDLEQTADGGFIVLGETNSTDGDVIAGFGGTKDIWLIKFSASGNVEWQKRYGGSGLDIGNHIIISNDGGYLIEGSTTSNDGDISGNHGSGGYTDAVLIKVTATGAVQWSKCFGGSKNDELFDMAIINGKMFLCGYANSVDGDIPPSQKNYDVWLLALDANGNKIFSKIYGGSQNDVAYSMTKGIDGSLTVAGYTTSNDGDVTGAKGSQDYWVLNISQSGNLNWQKVLGGTDAEYANTVITDKDGGYLIGGISYSTDGDISAAKGEGDFWVVKLNAAGNLLWKNNFGGGNNDHLHCMIANLPGNEYYLAGDTDSGDGDFSNGFGDTDFGIIKFKDPEIITKDSTVCDLPSFIPVTDTLKDACGYDSAIVKYNPVLISGPFDHTKKSDTIFARQSITLPFSGNGTVVWASHQSLSCTACPAPVATPTVTTVYTATNTLPNGCSVTGYFTVVVLKNAVVLTPNAFTPNGDGLNDFFGPLGKVPDEFSMQVYNRYGQIVFKSAAMNIRWDGKFKGELQPMGAFIYYISYKDINNKQLQQQGTVMLIR